MYKTFLFKGNWPKSIIDSFLTAPDWPSYSKICDKIIITDDNPREEDPSKIRKEIIQGIEKKFIKNVFEIPNRKEAISKSIELANKGDTILIAGKGHETIQIYGDSENYFDDYEEAKKLFLNSGIKNEKK